jgi:hypothetical protein
MLETTLSRHPKLVYVSNYVRDSSVRNVEAFNSSLTLLLTEQQLCQAA